MQIKIVITTSMRIAQIKSLMKSSVNKNMEHLELCYIVEECKMAKVL